MELLGAIQLTGKSRIQIVAAVVVLVFAGGIWLTGGKLEEQWLRFYGAAVFVAIIVLGFWDRFLWHVRSFQKLKETPRDLRGTWRGTLTSFWIDPETQKSPPPKPAYLVIRQTASSISVTQFTDESRSGSSLGAVTNEADGGSLVYMYLNRPDNRYEHRSRMHHGSTALDITGSPATRLRGRYWTDRDSRGELDFGQRVKAYADDYDTAKSLFPEE
jgi:hypothetical protein